MSEFKLYKGYYEIDENKTPLGNRMASTLEEVKDKKNIAAILSSDVCLLDVDDKVQADLLQTIIVDMQLMCIIQNTNKGKHFIFKAPELDIPQDNGMFNAFGIKMDYRSENGQKTIRLHGNDYRTVATYEGVTKEPDVCPIWLLPIKRLNMKDEKLAAIFEAKKSGDSRYEAVNKYVLELYYKYGLAIRDCQTVGKLIDKWLLDNHLKKTGSKLFNALKDANFAKYTRAANGWDKLVGVEKKEHINVFSERIQNMLHTAKINNKLCWYNRHKGVYSYNEKALKKKIIKVNHLVGLTDVDKVIDYLDIMSPEKELDKNYINFSNGLYNLETKTLIRHTHEVITYNQIEWELRDFKEPNKVADDFIKSFSSRNSDKEKLLYSMIGYSLLSYNPIQKGLFFVVGPGRSGKSTFVNILQEIFRNNYSSVELQKISKTFNSSMFGKLVNLADDASSGYCNSDVSAMIKRLSGGCELSIEEKFKESFQAENYANLWVSLNEFPKFAEKDDALERRIEIFEAVNKLSAQEADTTLGDKLKEKDSIEFIIWNSVLALHDVLDNRDFPNSDTRNSAMRNFTTNNNSVLGFLNEYTDKIVGITKQDLYDEYKSWCKDNNNNHSTSIKEFTAQVCKEKGLTVKRSGKGSRPYVYVK